MVCKEDLCFWFKTLHPRKRIDYLCGLLHMCLPLELRFVGTVLEEKGKKDYAYLRNQEVEANKQAELEKYRNISSPSMLRSKVLVALALMKSSSTTCAQIIYDIMESRLDSVFSFTPGDEDSSVAEEILTLLTLAVHHPAFMFEQRRRLHEHLSRLESLQHRDKVDEEPPLDLFNENHTGHFHSEETRMPTVHTSMYNRISPIPQSGKVYVRSIEVHEPRNTADKKPGLEYRIITTWSNGEKTEVGKRFKEIQSFQMKLMEMFPEEQIPLLTASGPHSQHSREEHIKEQIQNLNMFFSTLTMVPEHIRESELLCQFLRGDTVMQPPPQTLPVLSPIPFQHTMASMPDDEEMANAIPPHIRPMTIRNSHLYYLTPNLSLNDAAGRMSRFVHPHPQFYYFGPPQRFPPSHACQQQQLLMPAHMLTQQLAQPQPVVQQQQQQQPSPVSPPRSELSSTTTSPTGSRCVSPELANVSVLQLLQLLKLDKYGPKLAGLTVEQLSVDDLTKYGLPREAQQALRSKLEQITSEKPAQLPNGMIEPGAYPTVLSQQTPSSPSTMHWVPTSNFSSFMAASSSLPVDGMPAGFSPPVSPGPISMQAGILGKAPPLTGDSSEGSEDIDKPENVLEAGRVMFGKSGQGGFLSMDGGRSNSPLLHSANARMTPPDEVASKATILAPQPGMAPIAIPYYPYPMAPNPQGLLVQPPDAGLVGGVPNMISNCNNNSYTTDSTPIMSTGIPQRPNLLAGGQPLRGNSYKAGQPQPAHTIPGVLSKNLITMPAEPKPGSPVVPMPYLNMQTPVVPGPAPAAAPPMEGVSGQRMPLYHMPYGRGQGGPMATPPHILPVHAQTQPGVIPVSLVTRSMQTNMPGSTSIMTVSSSHHVTTVTPSHPAPSASLNRSPGHSATANGGGGGGMQREASVEVITSAMSDISMRSSPLPVVGPGMTHVSATPSPPACSVCAQGAQYSNANQYGTTVIYPPYSYVLSGPNGLIPQMAHGYFATHGNQALGSMSNGYGGPPEMYSYSQPAYPGAMNPGSMYPMMQGSAVYQPPQGPPVGQVGNSAPTGPPQPTPGGMGGAGHVPQAGGVLTIKQRNNTGCFNCGSHSHKAVDCPESTMETMSGKAVFSLDYKTEEED